MKRFAFASIAVLLAVCSYATLSASAADRPQGVAAENWIPVSDRLGIVLVESGRTVVVSSGADLQPPTGGYFMVKGHGAWSRLVVVEPMKGPAGAG